MKFKRILMNSLCVLLSVSTLFLFSACSPVQPIDKNITSSSEISDNLILNSDISSNKSALVFTENDNYNLISPDGIEYYQLANEEFCDLSYIGELEFFASVEGEVPFSEHLDSYYRTGLFSIKTDETKDILIRYSPANEWYSIYRKVSLPKNEFKLENCTRLEMIFDIAYGTDHSKHALCNYGITDKSEIKKFISDVHSQKFTYTEDSNNSTKSNNDWIAYEGCKIFGTFENEPYLVISMTVCNYDNQTYSIMMDNEEYLLPDKWYEKLKNASNVKH